MMKFSVMLWFLRFSPTSREKQSYREGASHRKITDNTANQRKKRTTKTCCWRYPKGHHRDGSSRCHQANFKSLLQIMQPDWRSIFQRRRQDLGKLLGIHFFVDYASGAQLDVSAALGL